MMNRIPMKRWAEPSEIAGAFVFTFAVSTAAMLACVLADHALRHRAQCGDVVAPVQLEKPKKIN